MTELRPVNDTAAVTRFILERARAARGARVFPIGAVSVADRYRAVRGFTETLCDPLEVEDYGVQSMPDCSPVKWHAAHTTWFFETFLLRSLRPDEPPFHPRFGYLFNSYYEAEGERHARPRRGLLTRPTVAEVRDYRRHVDERMLAVLDEKVVTISGLSNPYFASSAFVTAPATTSSINMPANSRPRSSTSIATASAFSGLSIHQTFLPSGSFSGDSVSTSAGDSPRFTNERTRSFIFWSTSMRTMDVAERPGKRFPERD